MFTVKFKGCPQVAVSSQILRLRVDSGRGHRVDAPFTPALLRRSNARAAAIGGRARTGKGKWRSRPISRVLSWTVIPLGDASPRRSSSLPGPDAGRVMRSLFGLAPGGVCRAGLLPGSRCALTAPFHPCLIPRHPAAAFPEGTWPMLRIVMSPLCGAAPGWRGPSAVSFCCTFRRLAPPRRYLAPCPVEPGLSSACLRMTRLSGRLRRLPFYGFRRRVSGSHEIRFSYSKPGASTPGGAAAAGATASASGGAAAARPERKHRLRAGAAATRGFRPPRGSASCSNTRARYIHVPLGRNPLAATSFAGRDVLVSLGHSNSKSSAQRRCPCSTKPRASTWRKTRWCGDRAQAGHGWPALACWSQGRRNQAMRTIPALPRLPPKPTNPGALRPNCRGSRPSRGSCSRFSALHPKPTNSSALRPPFIPG